MAVLLVALAASVEWAFQTPFFFIPLPSPSHPRQTQPQRRSAIPLSTTAHHEHHVPLTWPPLPDTQPALFLSLLLDVLNPILELLFALTQWSSAQIHAPKSRQRDLIQQVCKLLLRICGIRERDPALLGSLEALVLEGREYHEEPGRGGQIAADERPWHRNQPAGSWLLGRHCPLYEIVHNYSIKSRLDLKLEALPRKLETMQARRFWSFKREPNSYYIPEGGMKNLPVDLERLPRTDMEMLQWLEGGDDEEVEDDDDGAYEDDDYGAEDGADDGAVDGVTDDAESGREDGEESKFNYDDFYDGFASSEEVGTESEGDAGDEE
ncbi:hypothetical protein BDK51DRAFT_48465 [Blyttiomyces helicus]|uniref:Uncharacterized protein n=1 Tax=Blyttiomyces helicus TaxID=388810 RepID=A0A4P9VTD5_9FUNG|nr:hypothetical protein BDK51DRAFT_48465 [Blyttiomyces helicus]|eukprot:RKO82774.1 hypothetical protein BDK51DRAFT_48465 [Blyttiomyces helicus]